MTRRWLTPLLLLLAAIVGGLTTLALDRTLHRPGPPLPADHGRRGSPHSDRGRDPHDWLSRELGLSAAQRQRLDSLLARQMEEIRALREETRPRYDSISARTRRAVDSLLTPEQREKMESISRGHASP